MTNLPLRPDGGIDWEKYFPDPEIRDHYRQFVAATLERVAKRHDEMVVVYMGLARNAEFSREHHKINPLNAIADAHTQSAAEIRAMKV